MSAPSAPLAVVTGASGFVGSHIVDELIRRGARVRCLVRERSPRRWLEGKPVEIVVAPLTDPKRTAAALDGADWIVHAAGRTSASTAKEFHEANVKGTETILRAAVEACPRLRRFLLVSSQAASGPSPDGRPVAENQLPQPVSSYGESKLRAEKLTMLLRDRLPVVAVRPPGVYGPRDTAFYRAFVAVKRHVLPVLRTGGRFSIIHAQDLAVASWLLLTDDRAVGEIFFASAPDVTDYEEFGAFLKEAMGTWAVRFTPPGFALAAGALLAEVVSGITGRPPYLSREKLREISAGDWICTSAKLRSRLGWEPAIPLREGVRATAAWYRESGWL
ncbi:MAG TPA: NAD-dependent epimerase/dehydratase family protein [Candidatus Eisenbacteria bacterium]